MIILTLITLALGVPAFWLTMRYNMHMFQLNTYLNNEQTAWISRNFRLQWILAFSMILGFISMPLLRIGFMPLSVFIILLIWLTLGVIIIVYRLMIEMSSKKPLVFTPRVKRMIMTIVAISLLMLVVPLVWEAAHLKEGQIIYIAAINGFVAWLVGAQLFMNMLANVINKPTELYINNGYINEAKKILAENPDLTIIGVTGSYGKTSVKFYLETLLKAKYSVLVTPESYNTPMGVVKTIRGQLKRSHEIFVCEMGARYVGEIKELCDLVHPAHGVIASVGPQHLDTFGSIENIQLTKFELADALPEGGMLFLNGDSEYITEHLDNLKKSGEELPPAYKSPIMYHAEGAKDGYYASNIKVSTAGTSFTAHTPDGDSFKYDMKLVGVHNVINVMAAIAVAHKMGIGLKELKIPVRRLQSVPHRMEMKTQGAVTVIDDAFNSNPVGSKAAVETLALFDGVRVLVTPGMVELGEDEADYNYKFGTYAADCCDYILLVGGKHTDPIKEGAVSAGFPEKKCLKFDRVGEAIDYAYSIKTGEGEHKYILLENDLPDNY